MLHTHNTSHIPRSVLMKAAKKKGRTGLRARLSITLAKLRKRN